MPAATSDLNKRLAVTGIGVISSLGLGHEAMWEAARRKQVRLTRERVRVAAGVSRSYYFHKVTGFDPAVDGLDSETLAALNSWKEGRVDEDLLWAIAAARMAINDSRLRYDPEDNDLSLFVTHENPGLELLFDRTARESFRLLTKSRPRPQEAAFIESLYQRCSADGYDAQTFMYLHLIQKALGLHGFTAYSCNACASGLYALEAAAKEIKSGGSSAAIIIASDHPRYIYKFRWFERQGLLAPDGLIKPFDAQRNGFTIGDGAAAIILEDWNQARARKAPIYAEYLGGGFGAQGWKVIVPDLTSGVYAHTMRLALKRAGLMPTDIDLINPHGAGTGAADAYEAKAITNVFGQPDRQPPVMALKPYIGHTLGGCALIETVLLVMCMRHGQILPTLNCRTVDPALRIRVTDRLTAKPLRYVMKTASGFAGFDASVVLGSA